MDPLDPAADHRLAAILFRVFVFGARLIAHEYKFRFTFELPKDESILRVKRSRFDLPPRNPDCI